MQIIQIAVIPSDSEYPAGIVALTSTGEIYFKGNLGGAKWEKVEGIPQETDIKS